MNAYKYQINKKGLVETTMGKLILFLILMAILISILAVMKAKMGSSWLDLSNIFTFGGA